MSRREMADARAWAVFLRPLIFSIANPPPPDEFATRCEAMAAGMPNVPEAMLLGWRQQEALRRFKFFPSVAEVWEWLEPDVRADRKTRALQASRDPARKAIPAHPPPPKTAEVIEEVREKVQAFMAQRNLATEGTEPEEPTSPSYLTAGQLLRRYEAIAREGGEGPCAAMAKLRAAALRRKLGVEA